MDAACSLGGVLLSGVRNVVMMLGIKKHAGLIRYGVIDMHDGHFFTGVHLAFSIQYLEYDCCDAVDLDAVEILTCCPLWGWVCLGVRWLFHVFPSAGCSSLRVW